MLIKTIKNYKDKETKLIYRTTDNCTIREVSDTRGEELIKAGVVEEVKPEVETKVKTKSKKNDEVKPEVENTETEEETADETEESAEDTKTE